VEVAREEDEGEVERKPQLVVPGITRIIRYEYELHIRVQREPGGRERHQRREPVAAPPKNTSDHRKRRGDEQRRQLAADKLGFHARRFANSNDSEEQWTENRVPRHSEPEND